jgi:hypothetical protein
MHTTNYMNTFIEVAEDCPVKTAEIPPAKAEKTIANIQFDILIDNPYRYTSDDVLFQVFVTKNQIAARYKEAERKKFFSKGQPCFRSSPLTKRYGWGVHSNEKGQIAIYAMESAAYKKMMKDKELKQIKAMRSKKP